MKTILNIIISIFLLIGCINVEVKRAKIDPFDSIKLVEPKCKIYKIISKNKIGKCIVFECINYEKTFSIIAEREYFYYVLRSYHNYLKENEIDSVKCTFIYPNRDNKSMLYKGIKNEILQNLLLRDSLNSPIFYKIINHSINKDEYFKTTLILSYIYGKIVIGKDYHFMDEADIFDFYYFINNEILKKEFNKDNFQILLKMESELQKLDNIEEAEAQIKFLKSLYEMGSVQR